MAGSNGEGNEICRDLVSTRSFEFCDAPVQNCSTSIAGIRFSELNMAIADISFSIDLRSYSHAPCSVGVAHLGLAFNDA